jgi:hypothetical protein
MKRVNVNNIRPGDIILTARLHPTSKGIRYFTDGEVSHAMICVQYGSVIDSTSEGVQAWNPQRDFFSDKEEVFAFRSKAALSEAQLKTIIDYVRSEIGTRYSKREAVRTVVGGHKPRNERQFCSRLVARAYASAGVQLVSDKDYCSPEDLRTSPLLVELTDVVEDVSSGEKAAWRNHPDPIKKMKASQNAVLKAARRIRPSVENFDDLDQLVRDHWEHDAWIAKVCRKSGYLDVWREDRRINPWHYDFALMDQMTSSATEADIRGYCLHTVSDTRQGGDRFINNLVAYRQLQASTPRKTFVQFVELYEILVHQHQLRCAIAKIWLRKHSPTGPAA